MDLLQLTDFIPDMSICTSLYCGVNVLFQRINEVPRSKGMKDIPDNIIEGILLKDEAILRDASDERVDLVIENAERFTKDLLLNVSQAGMDLDENLTVFVGGGSLLLEEYIKAEGIVAKPIFVSNVNANAEGYQFFYESRKAQA